MPKKPATQWRRDLFPTEQKVNFVQLKEQWVIAENKMADDMVPVVNQIVARMITDIKGILNTKDYAKLNELKLGFKDKLINVIKQHLLDAFLLGKKNVLAEFKVDMEVKVPLDKKEFFAIQAEAVAVYLLNKIRDNAVFTVLSGLRRGQSDTEIIASLK